MYTHFKQITPLKMCILFLAPSVCVCVYILVYMLNLVGWCLIFVGPQAGVDSCYFPAPRSLKFLVDIWKISGPHM